MIPQNPGILPLVSRVCNRFALLQPIGLLPAGFTGSILIIDGMLTVFFVGGSRLDVMVNGLVEAVLRGDRDAVIALMKDIVLQYDPPEKGAVLVAAARRVAIGQGPQLP